jgi:2-polyprenyl-6-methoxyphenol hydroxylase-like FAD-dependent oxidoreductase
MSVVICGSGVAGMAAACALKQIGMSVKVIEKLSEATSNPYKYTGLWSPALQCLDKLGVYNDLELHLQPVSGSGYRDVSGKFIGELQHL